MRTSTTVIMSECMNSDGCQSNCLSARARMHARAKGADLRVFDGVASHLPGFLTLPVPGILLHLPLSLLLSPLLCLKRHHSCCTQHSAAGRQYTNTFLVLQKVAWLAAAALSTTRQAVHQVLLLQNVAWLAAVQGTSRMLDTSPLTMPLASTAVAHVSLDVAYSMPQSSMEYATLWHAGSHWQTCSM